MEKRSRFVCESTVSQETLAFRCQTTRGGDSAQRSSVFKTLEQQFVLISLIDGTRDKYSCRRMRLHHKRDSSEEGKTRNCPEFLQPCAGPQWSLQNRPRKIRGTYYNSCCTLPSAFRTGLTARFRGGGPFPSRSSKKISFTWPWLHFLEVLP
jgi:hypothetical protein